MKVNTIETDLLVIGGGMAGTISAIAAARNGVKVLLLEKNGCLGGIATTGLLGEINGFTKNGKRSIGGVAAEIVDNMIDKGYATINQKIPMTSNPLVLVDRVKFNPEFLKVLLDEKVKDENIHLMLNCYFEDINIEDSFILVTANNIYEKLYIKCSTVIDATGNAYVALKAGAETYKGRTEDLQSASLLFKVSNVDNKSYESITAEKLKELISEGVFSNMLPARYLSISIIPGTNDAIINATRMIEIDHENVEDTTRAQIEGRQQIKSIIHFLNSKVPGFNKAYLSTIASVLGVRDSRRIIGRYILLGDDLLNGCKFEDSVAIGCYPIDIHNSKTKSVDFMEIQGNGFYEIPYACLLPQNIRGIITAGKCISVDKKAFGSIRVVPTVMATGEAAGLAACLAIKKKIDPSCIETKDLQTLLNNNGVLFKCN